MAGEGAIIYGSVMNDILWYSSLALLDHEVRSRSGATSLRRSSETKENSAHLLS